MAPGQHSFFLWFSITETKGDRIKMAYDIVLDVRAPLNRNVQFRPADGTLRSEIRIENIRSKNLPGKLNAVGGFIPGHRVEIDMKANGGKGRARIVDRMHLKEFAEKDKQVRKVFPDEINGNKSFTDYNQNDDGLLSEGVFELNGEPPTNLATWLFWCLRLVQDGSLHYAEGSAKLPSMNDIRRSGIIYKGEDFGLHPRPGMRPFNYLYPDDAELEPAGAKS